MSWGELLFSFRGRINRAKYWATAVFYFLVLVVGGLAVSLLAEALGYGREAGSVASPLGVAGLVVLFILAVVLIISTLAVAIKRLHDREKSGWWILVFYVLPGVLSAFAEPSNDPATKLLLTLVPLGISIWGLVELGFLRGTAGPNRYGPDPLGT